MKKVTLNRLKLPMDAFLLESVTQVNDCKTILNSRKLNFESIAREIVNTVQRGKWRNSNQCTLDDDCNNKTDEKLGNSTYVVCTKKRCEVVTGGCLEDADCSVRQFFSYRINISISKKYFSPLNFDK